MNDQKKNVDKLFIKRVKFKVGDTLDIRVWIQGEKEEDAKKFVFDLKNIKCQQIKFEYINYLVSVIKVVSKEMDQITFDVVKNEMKSKIPELTKKEKQFKANPMKEEKEKEIIEIKEIQV